MLITEFCNAHFISCLTEKLTNQKAILMLTLTYFIKLRESPIVSLDKRLFLMCWWFGTWSKIAPRSATLSITIIQGQNIRVTHKNDERINSIKLFNTRGRSGGHSINSFVLRHSIIQGCWIKIWFFVKIKHLFHWDFKLQSSIFSMKLYKQYNIESLVEHCSKTNFINN